MVTRAVASATAGSLLATLAPNLLEMVTLAVASATAGFLLAALAPNLLEW